MKIEHFFDDFTYTLTYVVFDEATKKGVVIDTVTNFDPASGRTSNESNDEVAAYLDENGIDLLYVLDTHAHADHFSGMPYFKEKYGAKTVIGDYIKSVQKVFCGIFTIEDCRTDGSHFDLLIKDGDTLEAGPLTITAIHTPGHTPACLTYHIGDALFVGDAMFMPDYGTGRCDFPGGSASALYDSVQKIYAFPDDTRIFTCHDYLPGGRELRYQSTVGEQKRNNIQLNAETTRADYIAFREARDATLSMPKLILPSLQVNIRAGLLPVAEASGISYLKLPLNKF
jgi:glyoxylase-like metal-dependent hydrolase (beta-lactamase superfamily II)